MSSVTTPIDAIDTQIALMENEILEESHRRTAFLINLRSKRNSLLPVFRLPPETLAIIFIHGARNHYESSISGCFTFFIPTWVNVSYVCRYWRIVALNCPTLWTYPFAKSLRWTEELLLRSKEASLKISFTYFFSKHEEVSWWPSHVDSLLKHSERIQELRIDVPLSFLPPTLTLCAPRLEKLHLGGLSADIITITDGDKFPLHTLKLVNCSLPWYSYNLRGLQTLILSNVYSPSPPNMAEFLAILSGMRSLTVLHLERVLSSARDFLSSGGLDVSPKITLPRLALLVVIESLSTVITLISCVHIPRRIPLELELLLEAGYTIGDFTPILSFLEQQFSQQSDFVSRSLRFDASDFFTLTFGLKHEPSMFEKVGDNIPLKIAIGEVEGGDLEGTEPTDSDIIGNIFLSLPLGNIQNLHVCCPEFPSDLWKKMLGCLDGLRHLTLSNGNMPDLSLLSLLAHTSQENLAVQPIPDQDPASSHMFVPALEQLELCQITFGPDHASSEGGMSQKSLFDALSTRKGLRDRLTMTECSFA